MEGNNNSIEKFSDRKVTGKQLIVPFVTIIAFFLVTGGLSYAYYAFVSASGAQTSWMNTSFPTKFANTVSVSGTTCSISITDRAVMNVSNCSNTTNKGTATCYVNITMNGNTGSSCTYKLSIANGTNGYAKSNSSITKEFTYQIAGAGTKAETQIAAGDALTSQTLSLTAAGAKTNSYTITTRFYNVCGQSQNALTNAFTSKSYDLTVSVADLSCTFAA